MVQIQLTVSEDGIVTVVEPGAGKLVDKEELHETIKMPADHTLTVHQLQQIVNQQVQPADNNMHRRNFSSLSFVHCYFKLATRLGFARIQVYNNLKKLPH